MGLFTKMFGTRSEREVKKLLPQVQQAAEAAKKPKKGLVSRVAKMMEEDDGNEIAGINALPPRVSKDEAYHPAKTPQKNGKRKR